jgi:hypothetical protein
LRRIAEVAMSPLRFTFKSRPARLRRTLDALKNFIRVHLRFWVLLFTLQPDFGAFACKFSGDYGTEKATVSHSEFSRQDLRFQVHFSRGHIS